MLLEVREGDCLALMRDMDGGSVDSIVTDPPYALEFMGKGWDKVLPGPEVWAECLRVAKPGAMLLAFGGTRTYHRLTCAIEDAGWEIRDCLSWLYGSGFPKSLDVSKAIDKAAGAEREVVGFDPVAASKANKRPAGEMNARYRNSPAANDNGATITAPATDAARLWHGWGTALKPAWEPIVLAMKPLDGTFAANALAHGVAGLNVDGCRVGTTDRYSYPNGPGGKSLHYSSDKRSDQVRPNPTESHPAGRWPANLVLSHHPDCRQVGTREVRTGTAVKRNLPAEGASQQIDVKAPTQRGDDVTYGTNGKETIAAWDCVEGCAVRMLDEQSGTLSSGKMAAGTQRRNRSGYTGPMPETTGAATIGDRGGASRFFYCAKASKRDRTQGGRVENRHPTVKPVELMRWLVRLCATPTGGLVLDPFCGSGSTLVACCLEGRGCIGLEQDPASAETARQRLAVVRSERLARRGTRFARPPS